MGNEDAEAEADRPSRSPYVLLEPSKTTKTPTVWGPDGEFGPWWIIVWPVCISNLARTGMNMTDTIVLGHLSKVYLQAASYAVIWTSLSSVITWQGTAAAMSILCASTLGTRQEHMANGNMAQAELSGRQAGMWLQLGLFFTTVTVILISISWLFAGDIMRAFIGPDTFDDNLLQLVNTYCRYLAIGYPAKAWYACINKFLIAQDVRLPQLIFSIIFLGINVLLNMVLVFGIGDWKGLGFIGSPIATVTSSWGLFLCIYIYSLQSNAVQNTTWPEKGLLSTIPSFRKRANEYLGQAVPLGLGGLLEDGQLQTISVLAGRISTTAAATHNAVFTVVVFLSSFMWAVSAATSVRIAFYVGEDNVRAAKLVQKIALVIAGTIGCFVALVLGFGRDYVGPVISKDKDIWVLASDISLLVGVGYVLMALFYVCMATLSGQARGATVAISFFVGAWLICVPFSYVFAFVWPPYFTQNGHRLLGLWAGLCIGYAATTAMAGYFVVTSDWRKIIEMSRLRNQNSRVPNNRNSLEVNHTADKQE